MPTPSTQRRDAIRARVQEEGRRASRASFEVFARFLLEGHFTLPPSPMHRELFGLLQQGAVERGMRLAVAAPRGHAKSTIATLAYPLWCACTGQETFIVLISHTADQAQEHLGHLKRELEANSRLEAAFPEAAGPPKSPPWRKDEVVTSNGVRVKALGAGNPVRGRRHGAARPGLIVLDDVENEADVRSVDQRGKTAEWFRSAVGQAGTGSTNLVVAGTLLHPDSLLATLMDPARSPGWTARRYRVVTAWAERADLWEAWQNIYTGRTEHDGMAGVVGVDAARRFFEGRREEMLEGTGVLWPERESYYELMVTRQRDGARAFSTEKQNEPVAPEDAIFREEDFQFWEDRFPTEAALQEAIGGRCLAYGACDPSLGKHGRGRDDTAIVTILVEPKTGIRYVVGVDIRRRTPDDTINAIIELNRRFNYVLFGFESVQFQEVLAEQLSTRSRRAGVEIPVRRIFHSADKVSRLQRLQPSIAAGSVLLSRRHTLLLEQLRQFPRGAHDDGPDALEMAVQVSTRRPWDGTIKMV